MRKRSQVVNNVDPTLWLVGKNDLFILHIRPSSIALVTPLRNQRSWMCRSEEALFLVVLPLDDGVSVGLHICNPFVLCWYNGGMLPSEEIVNYIGAFENQDGCLKIIRRSNIISELNSFHSNMTYVRWSLIVSSNPLAKKRLGLRIMYFYKNL